MMRDVLRKWWMYRETITYILVRESIQANDVLIGHIYVLRAGRHTYTLVNGHYSITPVWPLN